ncbi:hypothetical protein MKX01_010863 [Papaver californicum]|nr:hypothetical protein MKX01_010863 [Papaver californicum]
MKLGFHSDILGFLRKYKLISNSCKLGMILEGTFSADFRTLITFAYVANKSALEFHYDEGVCPCMKFVANYLLGASLVKQVSTATNTTAGDGTTCATVLTQTILTEGCKSVAAGVNVMDLRQGINMAVNAVIADLKSKALMISTPEEITQVGTISANGEREIGEMITKAMEKVGKEGVITVVDGNTMDNEFDIAEGMKLGRGYISPYFITDEKTQKCVSIS